MSPEFNAEHFNRFGKDNLPDYMGIKIVDVSDGYLKSRLGVQKHHLAPNGFLHAASVMALADTSAGYACLAHLPQGAQSFTTLELKANFVSSASTGDFIHCEARSVHLGRTTQVWEARVYNSGSGKLMASFGCTQLLIWGK